MTLSAATVFIVDDDLAVRDALAAAGRHLGLEVEGFDSALAFLRQFDAERNGCLVLDLKMPGMDGLELQRALADRGSCLPVIMISGHGDVPAAVHAMSQGALTFLEKPFGLDQITVQIRTALALAVDWRDRAQRRQEARQRLARLTPAQRAVFDLVAAGLSNRQIAAKLQLSLRAIEDRKSRLTQALECRSLVDLLDLAATAAGQTLPIWQSNGGAGGPPRFQSPPDP